MELLPLTGNNITRETGDSVVDIEASGCLNQFHAQLLNDNPDWAGRDDTKAGERNDVSTRRGYHPGSGVQGREHGIHGNELLINSGHGNGILIILINPG